jgi:Fe-S cluster assembly ATP-binding protein
MIDDLHVSVDGKEIVKGVSLTVSQNEIHAVMGPNGSGKSTLAYAVMGHPRYKITSGDIRMDGESLLLAPADRRARLGLFLAFQYPVAVSGLNLFNFLRSAYNAVHMRGNGEQKPIPFLQFKELLTQKLELLQMDESFVNRYLNEGLSGGEKKRCEILQLAVLEPKIAVLDETDSGLDIDALRVVADGVNRLVGPGMGALLITHYHRILRYIRPHHVHVMLDGKIVVSGAESLAEELENKGYQWVKEQYTANS